MIHRYLEDQIVKEFDKRKILVVFGARQVGKTTMVKDIMASRTNTGYFNCDQVEVREALSRNSLGTLSNLVGTHDFIIIDEAQRVPNIGISLKILIDNFPERNFIVTGSSSLDLARGIKEPLTGRYFSYSLFPISFSEIISAYDTMSVVGNLDERLIYGSYPEIVTTKGLHEKEMILKSITENYLFKDLFDLGKVKNTNVLRKILQALAYQIGGEVSYLELARLAETNGNTVQRYLDLCEQAFIVFSVPPYFRNKRTAISKMKKYYFYDTGVRNALIDDFHLLTMRNDIGMLWENTMVIERMKRNATYGIHAKYQFYKSYAGGEVDLIEETDAGIEGFEFKYSDSKLSGRTLRERFMLETGSGKMQVINKDNFLQFVQ